MGASTATAVEKITTVAMFLLVGDKRLPLREAKAKDSGNVYHGLLAKKANGERYLSPYGVTVPQLIDELPTTVRLLVQQIQVDGDESTVLDEKTVPVTLEFGYSQSGNPRVKFNGAYDIPFLGRKMLTISISKPAKPKDGEPPTNNVVAKAINMSQGGAVGGRRVTALDDL
jgi:hypothetical protein